jgi:hypothetical protein
LYFGRNRPGGGTVDDAEWRTFLNQVLTRRFPAGLTVVNATGQWKGESGVVEQEQSNVVTIYHAGDAASNQAVREVALEYKRRFGQEAVLREREVHAGERHLHGLGEAGRGAGGGHRFDAHMVRLPK